MKETALKWLEKQLYRKNLALYDAYHRPNCPDNDFKNLYEAIDVIEYLIKIVEKHDESNVSNL